MTNITPIIDQESGIQYQGVEDRSSRTGTYPVIGMITGQFRRGRFDKPMTITNENIKAQLGYDPTNPHYMAVQDVLSSGVPSVQVLRVGKTKSQISCAGAVFDIRFDPYDVYESAFEIEVDGINYGGHGGAVYSYIINHPVLKNILGADQDGYLVVHNLDTNSEHRIKITYAEGSRPLIQDVKIDDQFNVNSAYHIESDGERVLSISFCLSKSLGGVH